MSFVGRFGPLQTCTPGIMEPYKTPKTKQTLDGRILFLPECFSQRWNCTPSSMTLATKLARFIIVEHAFANTGAESPDIPQALASITSVKFSLLTSETAVLSPKDEYDCLLLLGCKEGIACLRRQINAVQFPRGEICWVSISR